MKPLQLVAQVGFNVALAHLAEQSLYRLGSEPVAGLLPRGEEHQPKALTPTLPAQLPVDAEQEFEHGAAAHGLGLLGVAGEADGDAAALHLLQALADALRRRYALAGGDAVLDARKLLEEASPGGDDQPVVGYLAGAGQQGAAPPLQSGGLRCHMFDPHAAVEVVQGQPQVLGLAQTAGDPDGPRQINEFRLGAYDRYLQPGVGLAQAAHGGEGGEAAADDGDALHGGAPGERGESKPFPLRLGTGPRAPWGPSGRTASAQVPHGAETPRCVPLGSSPVDALSQDGHAAPTRSAPTRYGVGLSRGSSSVPDVFRMRGYGGGARVDAVRLHHLQNPSTPASRSGTRGTCSAAATSRSTGLKPSV